MRSDLDTLMREHGIDGMVVLALDRYSPALHYVTGQKIHHALWLRSASGAAHLVVDPMERDQAALAGCEWSTYAQHGFLQLVKDAGSQARALATLTAKVLAELRVSGNVAFLGDASIGFAHGFARALAEVAPNVTIAEAQPDILAEAQATKDADELERIRHASRGAVEAMRRVREYLATLSRNGEGFKDTAGKEATLGSLRRLIHRTFTDFGLGEDGESIVALGRDAGVPHNRGNDADRLRPGAPILVDIFPGEAGGGYHTDMTRTFCLGPAPEPLAKAYAQCREAFDAAMGALKPGEPCRSYQELVCDVFEAQGHATPRTDAATREGYVHGLGHGVGLAVHEGPRLGGPPSNTEPLRPGHVVSIEPGLYYPERGIGVRIEDLVAVRADGTIENLTPAPYELEVPIPA